jgi:hypothetical protein
MANQDLLKQAIAEAKAVREAAISNAKDVMEESLTPHIKDMLAAKLQEMEEEEMDETVEEGSYEEDEMEEGGYKKDMDELVAEEEDEPAEDDAEESEDEAEDETMDGEEEAEEIEDMNVEDLKNLIRDIIAQEMGGGEMEDMEDMEDMSMDDEPGGVEDMVATDDEEINLEELLAELESLSEEEEVAEAKHDDEDAMEEAKHEDEMEESAELNEALKTVRFLRKELSEVNLLNSKLLYVNKIFKAHNLSEAQKVNIITTFDKAETVKEVKLVYETVADNIGTVKSKKTQIKEHKSFASKASGNSTKREVISEVSDQVRRMQKLAGIIK